MSVPIPSPTRESIERAAQCWCDPTTQHLVMEPALAMVFAHQLDTVIEIERCKALAQARKEWKLVPREPTQEMWAVMGNALVGYKQRHHDKVAEELWQAAYDAAPTTDTAQEKETKL